jgi:hypothetical protein
MIIENFKIINQSDVKITEIINNQFDNAKKIFITKLVEILKLISNNQNNESVGGYRLLSKNKLNNLIYKQKYFKYKQKYFKYKQKYIQLKSTIK